jgi:hypothetical protein
MATAETTCFGRLTVAAATSYAGAAAAAAAQHKPSLETAPRQLLTSPTLAALGAAATPLASKTAASTLDHTLGVVATPATAAAAAKQPTLEPPRRPTSAIAAGCGAAVRATLSPLLLLLQWLGLLPPPRAALQRAVRVSASILVAAVVAWALQNVLASVYIFWAPIT